MFLLGPLERRVLDAMWKRARRSSVRDLLPDFPDLAYTTLMTTLDRLHRKGMLARYRSGRAFVYEPRAGREETTNAIVHTTLCSLVGDDSTALRPVASFLLERIESEDAEVLDQLERLIAERRGHVRRGTR